MLRTASFRSKEKRPNHYSWSDSFVSMRLDLNQRPLRRRLMLETQQPCGFQGAPVSTQPLTQPLLARWLKHLKTL